MSSYKVRRPEWTYDRASWPKYTVFPPGRHGEIPNPDNPQVAKLRTFDTYEEAESWVRSKGGVLVKRR